MLIMHCYISIELQMTLFRRVAEAVVESFSHRRSKFLEYALGIPFKTLSHSFLQTCTTHESLPLVNLCMHLSNQWSKAQTKTTAVNSVFITFTMNCLPKNLSSHNGLYFDLCLPNQVLPQTNIFHINLWTPYT